MNPKLTGEVTLLFVRADMSKKNKPYLILANGRKEFFVWPTEDELALFSDFEENQEITLEVEVMVGSDSVKVLAVH